MRELFAMNRLSRIRLTGFKSIRELDLQLGPVNVLIGANGSGKSNFISCFRLLNSTIRGELQLFVARIGGANALLHHGAATTTEISADLRLESEVSVGDYGLKLSYAAPDTLIIPKESYGSFPRGFPDAEDNHNFAGGLYESAIAKGAASGDKTAQILRNVLSLSSVFHFHNTSETARVRQRWSETDNGELKEDAANLAPVLLRLREHAPRAYGRIVDHIRQVSPFFADFVLDPIAKTVLLQWREIGSDMVFGAHQGSDGMLRTFAIFTLLLQPVIDDPEIIILDEPELGLHPYAITVMAGLIKGLSQRKQIILATQSVTLLEQFDPEDVIVVDRHGRESTFRRLDAAQLQEWLEEYTLGELWEKNVLGGRPAR